MTATIDNLPDASSSRSPDRRRRVPVAGLLSLPMAGALVPLLIWVANMALWETVDFAKNWGYFVAGTAALGIGTGALLWLAVLHRRWWFLCVPSIVLWCLILFLVVAGRIEDGEDGFGFHCATIQCGESIDAFAERMARWGHSPPTYEPDGPGLASAVFQGDLDTCFYVRFYERSRTVVEWYYSSV